MKILAIEFSSGTRSVAVIDAPGTLDSGPAQAAVRGRAEQQAGRGTRAFALVETALREAGIEREQVDLLAVGLGPGSYTGIRVAIAVAQGWQLARAVRVLGLNSVEVLAWQMQQSGVRGPATFLLDAQRGEYYCARYELGPLEPRELEPLRLARADEVPSMSAGLMLVEPELLKRFPAAQGVSPDATTLGLLAARRDDFMTADRLEPIYLRAPSFVKAPPPRVIPPLCP